MQKSSEALLFFFLFLFLFSSNVMAVYTSLSGHDEEFTTSASQSLLSYEWQTQSCFNKGWYSSYQNHNGVVYFNSNCSIFTTHTFYLKDAITQIFNSPYPVVAEATYYINTTTNWVPLNRPSFYIYDVNTSENLYEVNLPTSSGWNTISTSGSLTAGHQYWVILDFKTWTSMPSVFIAVDSMTFGSVIGSGLNPSSIVDMPLGCRLKSGQSYFYPYANYQNTTDISIIQSQNTGLASEIFSPFSITEGIGQTFSIPQNATLSGIMINFGTTGNSICGTYNLSICQWNGDYTTYCDLVIQNTSWGVSNSSGFKKVIVPSVILNTSYRYVLKIFNTSSINNCGYPTYSSGDPYTDGQYIFLWHTTGWDDWSYPTTDLTFILNLTTIAGSPMPQAIQSHTSNSDWAKISLIHAFDGSQWNIYNKTSESGNLSIIYRGNIFSVDTLNNSQITLTDCNGLTCDSYTTNTIYSYPYAYNLMPQAIQSHIQNWNDVSLVYGHDGVNWNYYDPTDPSSATLLSLQRGQAFYIITKSGASYTMGSAFYGSICNKYDYSGRGYIITQGCNITSGQCPINTKCSQITPQAGITTPLIENFVDCSMCWSLNTFVGEKLIWTNCPNNPECRCTDSGLCKANVYRVNITSTPFSVLDYTIGCYDPYGQKVLWIVNATGGNTTEEALINQALNQTTPITTPQPNSIISLGAGINTNLGTAYGSMLIAFICSIFFATTLFFKTEDKKIEAFAVPFLAILGGFALPGVEFFPLWIWILMTVMTGVMIFWKAKGG